MNSTEPQQNSEENNYLDCKSLYDDIQQTAHIPGIARETTSPTQVVIRDMYINLGDVYNNFQTQGVKPKVVFVYADAVLIPANVVLDGTGLIIAARRVEVEGNRRVLLDYRKSLVARLIVYTNELVGSLDAVAVTSLNPQEPPTVFPVGPVDSKGVLIAYRQEKPTKTPLDRLEQGVSLAIGEDFYISLVSIFQFATLLFDTNPQLADSMLSWIKGSTAESLELTEMNLQSSSLLVMLKASYGKATFVPSLDQQLYKDLAKAFVDAAQAYERNYERFSDKNEAIESRKEAAKLMLAERLDKTGFVNKLIEQTLSDLQKAENAVNTAKNRLESQNNKVNLAKISFELGLKQWEYEQTLKAVFQGIGAVLSFAAAIPALFAGQPQIAATAVASVPAKFTEIAKVMEMLAKITSALQNIVTASQQIKEASNNLSQAGSVAQLMNQIGEIGNEDLSGSLYWDEFELETAKLLKIAIDNNVGGAQEYKLQLDILALYGKSLATNQLAVVRITQELVRLNLQREVSEKQQQRLSDYVNSLSASQPPNADMIQMFYQRYLDVKRSLFIALKNYSWAYKYWALRDSSFKLSILKNVPDLKNDLAKIQQDYTEALESFDPPPQELSSITYRISAPEVLESLRQTKEATWPITLDNGNFSSFHRVRLSTIRVWIEGVRLGGKSIFINITNSGNYRDHLKGQNYQFTAAPLTRGFQYRANLKKEENLIKEVGGNPNWLFNNGESGYVELDGKVVNKLDYAYFEPTPFSDWKISLTSKKNEGIDLSGVTQIVMEFAGSVISSDTSRLMMLKR